MSASSHTALAPGPGLAPPAPIWTPQCVLPLGPPLPCSAIDQLQCAAGNYCPTPAEACSCPEGSFCKPGTVQPETCNITYLVGGPGASTRCCRAGACRQSMQLALPRRPVSRLPPSPPCWLQVDSAPMTEVPAPPQTVYERVYLYGIWWGGLRCHLAHQRACAQDPHIGAVTTSFALKKLQETHGLATAAPSIPRSQTRCARAGE